MATPAFTTLAEAACRIVLDQRIDAHRCVSATAFSRPAAQGAGFPGAFPTTHHTARPRRGMLAAIFFAIVTGRQTSSRPCAPIFIETVPSLVLIAIAVRETHRRVSTIKVAHRTFFLVARPESIHVFTTVGVARCAGLVTPYGAHFADTINARHSAAVFAGLARRRNPVRIHRIIRAAFPTVPVDSAWLIAAHDAFALLRLVFVDVAIAIIVSTVACAILIYVAELGFCRRAACADAIIAVSTHPAFPFIRNAGPRAAIVEVLRTTSRPGATLRISARMFLTPPTARITRWAASIACTKLVPGAIEIMPACRNTGAARTRPVITARRGRAAIAIDSARSWTHTDTVIAGLWRRARAATAAATVRAAALASAIRRADATVTPTFREISSSIIAGEGLCASATRRTGTIAALLIRSAARASVVTPTPEIIVRTRCALVTGIARCALALIHTRSTGAAAVRLRIAVAVARSPARRIASASAVAGAARDSTSSRARRSRASVAASERAAIANDRLLVAVIRRARPARIIDTRARRAFILCWQAGAIFAAE